MAPKYFMALLALLPLIMASKSAVRGNAEVVKNGKVSTKDTIASSASWSYFTAYPACCPGLANYDPAAPTTECTEYNRCAHPGNFLALGQRDPAFVQNTDLVSFYDKSDPQGKSFYNKYGDKTMTITATCNGVTQTFDAIVADTCGNSDCNNCCDDQADPNTGYWLSMEYNTVMRHFGDANCANPATSVSFSIDTAQAMSIPNCGNGQGGNCNIAQTCCSVDGYCGQGMTYCGTGCQASYGSCAGDYSCGLINGATCPSDAPCCSQYGYCATTDDACGAGCQSAYGECDSQSSSNGVSGQFAASVAVAALPLLGAFVNM